MSKRKQSEARFTEFMYGVPLADLPVPVACPFCGDTEPSVVVESRDGPFAVVECNNCGVQGPCVTGSDGGDGKTMRYAECAREAARLWNTRPPPKRRKQAA